VKRGEVLGIRHLSYSGYCRISLLYKLCEGLAEIGLVSGNQSDPCNRLIAKWAGIAL
jgi:hypothetical protein